jgi:hypothetical protein
METDAEDHLSRLRRATMRLAKLNLRLIENRGAPDPQPRQFDDKYPFILPPIRLSQPKGHEFECAALGVSDRQFEMIWQARWKAGMSEEFMEAFCNTHRAWRELMAALEAERRVMLAVMMQRYPAMARRIMKGYARKPA